jgi:hypothetical protein
MMEDLQMQETSVKHAAEPEDGGYIIHLNVR